MDQPPEAVPPADAEGIRSRSEAQSRSWLRRDETEPKRLVVRNGRARARPRVWFTVGYDLTETPRRPEPRSSDRLLCAAGRDRQRSASFFAH